VCHVAINLPAKQSSVYVDTYIASFANDGSRRTSLDQFSCAHSWSQTNPWWVVDVGIPLTVTGVFFTNRDAAGAFIEQGGPKKLSLVIFAITLSTAIQFFVIFGTCIHYRKLATGKYIVSPPNMVYVTTLRL